MIDAIVRSTIFGVRNADKVVNTNDKGRIFADIGQFTNALSSTAELDNKLGKGAQAAITAMASASKESSVLRAAGKGAKWAAKNVNPLLIGAAGYRVLIADDKGTALKKETLGMASMFFVEGLMKDFFKSNIFTNLKSKVTNKYVKAGDFDSLLHLPRNASSAILVVIYKTSTGDILLAQVLEYVPYHHKPVTDTLVFTKSGYTLSESLA